MKTIGIWIDDANHPVDNIMQRQTVSALAGALCEHFKIQWIDGHKMGHEAAVKAVLAEDYDALFLYNKSGTRFQDAQQRRILSWLNKPRVSWLVEHPVTFATDYLPCESEQTHYVFAHEHHANFMYGAGSQASYSCMPFGGYVQAREQQVPRAERPFDICVAASWRGSETSNVFWRNSTPTVSKFYEDVLLLQDQDEHRDIFNAYILAAKINDIAITDVKDHIIAMKALYWYERKRERINLVRDLCATGLKVLLIGDEGWREVIGEAPNVTRIDPCTHEALFAWYGQSKSVACMNNFNGANERIFDALGAGALPLVENDTQLIASLNEDLTFTYRPNEFKSVAQALPEWLAQRDGDEVLEQANAFMQAGHTWSDRAESLAQVLTQLVNR